MMDNSTPTSDPMKKMLKGRKHKNYQLKFFKIFEHYLKLY